MIYTMNLIIANAHIITCLITTLTTEIIILFALTIITIIMLGKGVERIREILKVIRQMQEKQ